MRAFLLTFFRSAAFLVALVILGMTGCSFFGGGSREGTVTDLLTNSQPTSGPATVNFKVVFPENALYGDISPRFSRAAIMADNSTGTARVTFRIMLFNRETPETPLTTLTRTVDVDSSGTASAAFGGLPVETAIGEISIENGQLGGKSEFQGASDLIAGENVLEVSPKGSGAEADIIADAVKRITNSPDLVRNAPTQLATLLRAVGNTEGLLASPTPTVYSTLVDLFVIKKFSAAAFVKIEGSGLDSIRGTGGPNGVAWTRKISDLFAGTGCAGYPWLMGRVLRQGFGAFTFVTFFTEDKQHFAVVKIDSATGARLKFLYVNGDCRPAVLTPWDGLLIGGTIGGFPLLLSWNGTFDDVISPTSLGTTDSLPWIQQFKQHVTADLTLLPNPLVRFLEFDRLNSGRLIVVIEDPGARCIRTLWIDPAKGLVLKEITPIRNGQPAVSLWARSGDGFNVIGWDTLPVAKYYNLYWHTVASLSFTNYIERIENATSPFRHEGLVNGRPYHYMVSWVGQDGVESTSSARIVSVPHADQVATFTIQGKVLSDADKTTPVAGIDVGFFLSGVFRRVVTDNQGNFSFPAVVPGLHLVVAGRESPDWEVGSVTILIASDGTILPANPTIFVKPALLKIEGVFPTPGAQNVATGANILARFNVPVSSATVDSTTFGVMDITNPVPVAIPGRFFISTDLRTVVFKPETGLPGNAGILVDIATGMKDLRGRPLVSPVRFEFHTGSGIQVPLEVISCFPREGMTEVATNTASFPITVTFNVPIATSSLTRERFSVHALATGGETLIGGILSVDPTGTLISFSGADLPEGTLIRVTIASEVTDIRGVPLGLPFIWRFHTARRPFLGSPRFLNVVPENGRCVLSWPPVPGATGYNLYWSSEAGVTRATGVKIPGIPIPLFVHTGLRNGQNYHYIVTAFNEWLESGGSPEASGTPTDLGAVLIQSTPLGGRWFDPSTWAGNHVPTQTNDVALAGPVIVDQAQDGSPAVCRNLAVTPLGSLRNPPGSETAIVVAGGIVNQGAVLFDAGTLTVRLGRNLAQTGRYTPTTTVFTGTEDQWIALPPGGLLTGNFRDELPASKVRAASNLAVRDFILTFLGDASGTLDMSGFGLVIDGGPFTLVNGDLRCGNILAGPGSRFNCPRVTTVGGDPIHLGGQFRPVSCSFESAVVVRPGTTVANQLGQVATLTITGNLVNNGQIAPIVDLAGGLHMVLGGHLFQNDEYAPTDTRFVSEKGQGIFLAPQKILTGLFIDEVCTKESPLGALSPLQMVGATFNLGTSQASGALVMNGCDLILRPAGLVPVWADSLRVSPGVVAADRIVSERGAVYNCPRTVPFVQDGVIEIAGFMAMKNGNFLGRIGLANDSYLFNPAGSNSRITASGPAVFGQERISSGQGGGDQPGAGTLRFNNVQMPYLEF